MSCVPVFPCQIAAVQAAAETALQDTVIVKRKTATQSDGAGHLKPTSGDGYTTIATVAGLLTPVGRRSPTERLFGEQTIALADHYVYVAHDTDIKPKDRLVIGTRTFEVQGTPRGEAVAILDQVSVVELQK